MTGSSAPVSAIIAVKDAAAHMRGAIESVLDQSPPPQELIVVDGHSSDASVEIAESYEGVTPLVQPGTGLAEAWNVGIEACRGRYIAFLDSDDIWLPGKIEAQLAELEARPELAGVIGHAEQILGPGVSERPSGFRQEWLDGDYPAPMPGTLMVRREVFDEVGLFDPSFIVAMDVDWMARVKDAGLVIGTVPRLMLEKRFDGTNLSLRLPDVYHREMVRAMRESAQRQSAAAQ